VNVKEDDRMKMPGINRLELFILVALVAVDLLIITADLAVEKRVDILTLASAVAVIGLCALVWSGVSWGRWLLLGFIALRIILIGKVVISSFGPGEVLRPGAMAALLLYVVSAMVLAAKGLFKNIPMEGTLDEREETLHTR
jgi:hypothetical protein